MIQAIGTGEKVYRNSAGELKSIKTLKTRGKIDENSENLVVFGNKRYTKTEIQSEKTGKTEYLYVSIDDDVKDVKNSEEYITTPATNDGKDDGKLENFGEVASSFCKGIIKPFKSMFTDKNGNFSLTKSLISVGVAAAAIGLCCIPVVGPFISAGFVTLGLASGIYKIVKGARNLINAKTDAEARDALGDIGDGVFTFGTSLLGAKALNKSAAASSAGMKLPSPPAQNPPQITPKTGVGTLIKLKNFFHIKKTNFSGIKNYNPLSAFKSAHTLSNAQRVALAKSNATGLNNILTDTWKASVNKYINPHLRQGFNATATDAENVVKTATAPLKPGSTQSQLNPYSEVKNLKAAKKLIDAQTWETNKYGDVLSTYDKFCKTLNGGTKKGTLFRYAVVQNQAQDIIGTQQSEAEMRKNAKEVIQFL